MRRAFAVPLAILLSAARASAQGNDVTLAEAQARFQEGLALHDAGREDEAYAKFVQAYAMVHSPSVLFNLARTEELTGRLLDARTHFLQYVDLPPDTPKVSASLRQKAREFLAEMEARLGQLTITATDGATIVVDGQALGENAPIAKPVHVMPGSHSVEAQLGNRSAKIVLTIHAGEVQTVALQVAAPSAAPEGALPAAAGDSRPPENAHPPLAAPTSLPVAVSLGSAPPSDAPADQARDGWSGTRSWLAPVVGIGALAAIGTGVGLQLAAKGDADRAHELSTKLPTGNSVCVQTSDPNCQPLYDANHSGQDKRNLAIPFFIAGAALAAATLVVLVWPGGKPNTKTALHLSASPASAGLQLRGGF
jgi:hypothetical protein